MSGCYYLCVEERMQLEGGTEDNTRDCIRVKREGGPMEEIQSTGIPDGVVGNPRDIE